MRMPARLAIALVVLAIAYVLAAPRIPGLQGPYEKHVCPYLDRVREGLCAHSLQAPDGTGAQRLQSVADQSARVSERLDRTASDMEHLRQLQQWQDSAQKQMEISLAQLHQKALGLEQAIDALRVEIERVRLGTTAPAEPSPPAPTIPAPPARRPGQR